MLLGCIQGVPGPVEQARWRQRVIREELKRPIQKQLGKSHERPLKIKEELREAMEMLRQELLREEQEKRRRELINEEQEKPQENEEIFGSCKEPSKSLCRFCVCLSVCLCVQT